MWEYEDDENLALCPEYLVSESSALPHVDRHGEKGFDEGRGEMASESPGSGREDYWQGHY
jgi:hypothetical protein